MSRKRVPLGEDPARAVLLNPASMSRTALEAEVTGHRVAYQTLVDDLRELKAQNAELRRSVKTLRHELGKQYE